MPPEEFDSLAATIDAVYHNGANVNFVYPYPFLKPVNVSGTVEVLRLATRTQVKPLHFVSTVSVFDAPEYGAVGTIREDQPLEAVGSLQGGYAQSKCVAEKLVRAAGQRGLPVAVYRPGRVTADSETGAESLADYTTLLLRLCIEMKMAPSSDDRVDMTPVDYVARAIVGLAQRAESMGKTFHLVNPRAVSLAGCLPRDPGVRLRPAGGAARGLAIQRDPLGRPVAGQVVHGLLALVDAHGFARTDGGRRAGNSVPSGDDRLRQTLSDLQPLGMSCPLVDVDRLKKQVLFLARRRF